LKKQTYCRSVERWLPSGYRGAAGPLTYVPIPDRPA
jgi:hypothetical protein